MKTLIQDIRLRTEEGYKQLDVYNVDSFPYDYFLFNKQINTMARRVAKHTGITVGAAKEVIGSQAYYDFLHSRQFKEISKINKKASQEAIDFYVKQSPKYSDRKILKHFDKFLASDDEMTIKEVFPGDLKESKYLKARIKKGKR